MNTTDTLCNNTVEKFKQITRFYALFHIGFFTLALLELVACILFFSFFTKSFFLAISLATIFLTGFSYFVLLFYFQAKKPEQLLHLRNEYLNACRESIQATDLAHAMHRLIERLNHQEYSYYHLPIKIDALEPVVKKFSSWTHWKDVHRMKEMLLFVAIEQHIQWVKSAPADLQAHAALATAYLCLSKLYMDPLKVNPDLNLPWVPAAYFSDEMQEKFQIAAQRAIEEFKILDHYSPNDLWVHAQLAALYHDLDMPQLEIDAYETMLNMAGDDEEVLSRLGILYFEQGLNVKGLQVYEKLTSMHSDKAPQLINHYDAYIMET